MLSFEAQFDDRDLEKAFQEDLEALHDEAAEVLFETGAEMVDRARALTKSEGSFGNITWNLRGSIGCVLVHNGKIADEHVYFPQVDKGEEGVKTGQSFAREIALLTDDGDTTLVFVAGMEYAMFVRSKGIDIIDGSTAYFQTIFTKLFNQL